MVHANEDNPVFVVIDEMLADGDDVMFASTDRFKAYEYIESRFKPSTLRMEVWNGNIRIATERVV